MAAKRPNKLSISEMIIFCQIEFVQKNRFLYFARLQLVHFIQYSNLKKRIACATVCLQRERPKKQFSKAIRSKDLQDANNVTECFPCDDHGSYKNRSHAAQSREQGQGQGCFLLKMEDGWNLKNEFQKREHQKGSFNIVSRKGMKPKLGMQSEESEVNQ